MFYCCEADVAYLPFYCPTNEFALVYFQLSQLAALSIISLLLASQCHGSHNTHVSLSFYQSLLFKFLLTPQPLLPPLFPQLFCETILKISIVFAFLQFSRISHFFLLSKALTDGSEIVQLNSLCFVKSFDYFFLLLLTYSFLLLACCRQSFPSLTLLVATSARCLSGYIGYNNFREIPSHSSPMLLATQNL